MTLSFSNKQKDNFNKIMKKKALITPTPDTNSK